MVDCAFGIAGIRARIYTTWLSVAVSIHSAETDLVWWTPNPHREVSGFLSIFVTGRAITELLYDVNNHLANTDVAIIFWTVVTVALQSISRDWPRVHIRSVDETNTLQHV